MDERIHEIERLVMRAVDGEASEAEFEELRVLAAGDPAVWRELGESQRASAELAARVESVLGVADEVEAPVEELERVRPGSRIRSVWSAGGWLSAAAVLVAWVTTGGPRVGSELDGVSGAGGVNGASVVPIAGQASEALDRYLELGREQGRVLGEVPTGVVLERRPLEDGSGYEVIFLRQIMERAVVEDVYEIARDDAGNKTTVRVEPMGPTRSH